MTMQIEVDGLVYDRDKSILLRAELVRYRNNAIDQLPDSAEFCVTASHMISWMAQVICQNWEVTPEQLQTETLNLIDSHRRHASRQHNNGSK